MKSKQKNKKRISIYIESEYKEFYPALANLFYINNFDIKVFAKNNDVLKYISNKINKKIEIVNLDSYYKNFKISDIINKSVEFEKKYNLKINFSISQDRNLGQGYLLNTTKVPSTKASSWNYKKKLKHMISKMQIYDLMCDQDSFLFFRWPNNLLSSIAKYKNTNLISVNSVKFGNNFFFSDNEFNSSKELINNLTKNINKSILELKDIKYEKENLAKYRLVLKNDNLFHLISNCLISIINDIKIRLLRKKTDFSYQFFGWTKSYITAYFNNRYIEKIKIDLKKNKELKFVYFPLHCEPEVSLLNFSPENNNSLEVISWISKSLPANYILVLKEHPISLGVRTISFYQLINKLGNVFFVSTKNDSIPIIKKSSFVATITGSVSQEAVLMEKKVLSFGKNQYLNIISNVYYCSNFNETNTNIDKIINSKFDINELKKNKLALANALIDSSFEIKNFDLNFKNIKFADKIAQCIFNEFKKKFYK